jgi:hypothetical protein
MRRREGSGFVTKRFCLAFKQKLIATVDRQGCSQRLAGGWKDRLPGTNAVAPVKNGEISPAQYGH